MTRYLLAGCGNPTISALYRVIIERNEPADMVASSQALAVRLAVSKYDCIFLAEYLPGGAAIDVLRIFPHIAGSVIVVCESLPQEEYLQSVSALGGRAAGPNLQDCLRLCRD